MTTTRLATRLVCAALLALVGCGSSGSGTKTPDAAIGSAAAKITVSGTAQAQGASATPLAGVAIAAYRNGDETTPLATATSDTQGKYMMDIETGGVAIDGYIKATISSYLDTYLYPPAPLTTDLSNASINIVNTSTVALFATFCGASAIQPTDGVIAVQVISGTTAVAGATAASTPAATSYCYDGTTAGIPDKMATVSGADGIAYMLGVTGSASVTATKSGATFAAHTVNARPGTLTTTIISGS